MRKKMRKIDRATQLATRLLEGNASADEQREYEALYPVCYVCPVCGGSFRATEYSSNGRRCSQCGIELFLHSFERVGHDFYEIEPSITTSHEAIGVSGLALLPAGLDFCNKCGMAFPLAYTCCPGLFDTAVRLHRERRKEHGKAAIAFINEHSETLCNML